MPTVGNYVNYVNYGFIFNLGKECCHLKTMPLIHWTMTNTWFVVNSKTGKDIYAAQL